MAPPVLSPASLILALLALLLVSPKAQLFALSGVSLVAPLLTLLLAPLLVNLVVTLAAIPVANLITSPIEVLHQPPQSSIVTPHKEQILLQPQFLILYLIYTSEILLTFLPPIQIFYQPDKGFLTKAMKNARKKEKVETKEKKRIKV